MIAKSSLIVLVFGALAAASAKGTGAAATSSTGLFAAELTVSAPPGWAHYQNPQNRAVFMKPPDAPTLDDAGLVVFPAVAFNGTAEQFHAQTLAAALQRARLVEPVRQVTARGFLISYAHAANAQGRSLQLVLYTALWGQRAQAILFATARDDLFRSNARTAESTLLKVAVPGWTEHADTAEREAAPAAGAASGGAAPPSPALAAMASASPGAPAAGDGSMVPVLNYDEPANFYRGAGKNPYEYTSSEVNYALCVYPFRPYTGDIVAEFQQTMLRDWMDIQYHEESVAGQPAFSRSSIPGATIVIQARFHENIVGLLNERLRILIVAGNRAAVIDAKAPNAFCWEKAGPSVQAMLASVRVGQKTAGPSFGAAPDAATAAMAGLYAGTKAKYMAYGVTDFTGHVAARHFFLLSGDGRIFRCYDNPPAGGDWRQYDFDTSQREDPGNTGHFAVRGNQLYIKMGGPNADESTVTFNDPNVLEIDSVRYVRQR